MLINAIKNENISPHLQENIPQLSGTISEDASKKIKNILAENTSLPVSNHPQNMAQDPFEGSKTH